MSTTNPNVLNEKLRDQDKLGRALLDRGIISEQEFELVRQQAKATGIEMWRVLLNLNLVAPDTLHSLMTGQEPANAPKVAAKAPAEKSKAPAVREELAGAVELGDTPGLVEQILERAFEARATDIHFDPQDEGKMRIRYRVDGQMHDVLQLPHHMTQAIVSRLKIMANMDIIEKRDSQDGHIVEHLAGAGRNMRIATIPTNRGERLVARILDEKSVQVGIENLGFNQGQIESVGRLLRKPYGIIIVTGPVGSGKTTTLYSCVNRINHPTRNVMTIEDPVEYSLPGVNQVQVDPKIDWNFPKALRACLRQDPDIMMVGEIRDDETAHIAVRASLTGVLVLTSLHANDAASTINNLYNYGIPGYLISTSLLGVIAQRLVRKVNPESAEEYAPDDHIRKLIGLEDGAMPNLKLKRPKGTTTDFGTGYLGRTGVFEVMEINDVLRDMIFRETTKDVLRELAVDMGMLPLAQHAISKVLEGTTTIEEVYRVALF